MARNINVLMAPFGIGLDFANDVMPISKFSGGGSVTERHLLYALGEKLAKTLGRAQVASFLKDSLELKLSEAVSVRLSDPDNAYFSYDLLGALKAGIVARIYVPATDECLTLAEASDLAKKTGAVFCYAYLGDVGDSVTGDKKTQKFEDDYMDKLAQVLYNNGVECITYMPSRNTPAQLKRVREICAAHGFREISGEDINSPRQQFICRQLELPEFSHLTRATWELIEYERSMSREDT